jgi:hypothetical protein
MRRRMRWLLMGSVGVVFGERNRVDGEVYLNELAFAL